MGCAHVVADVVVFIFTVFIANLREVRYLNVHHSVSLSSKQLAHLLIMMDAVF